MRKLNIHLDRDALERDIDAVLELLGPVEETRDGHEPGTTEYLVHCCGHLPDTHASLVIFHRPHDPRHPVGAHCRAGCPYETIMAGLHARAAQAVEEDAMNTASDSPPKKEKGSGSTKAPSWASSTLHSPFASYATHCGTPLSHVKDNPDLPLEEELGENPRIKHMFPQTKGPLPGPVFKYRKMRQGKKQQGDVGWENAPTPAPAVWPHFPLTLPATIALSEGESDCILLRYWGYAAYALTAGAGTSFDPQMFPILYDRGVRRILIFYDRDTAGRKNALRLIRLCQDALIVPVPVDLTTLVDPLVGGYKDVRELRHLWESPEEARAAIEGAIKATEQSLDRLFPNFEDAYAHAPDDDPWLVEDIVARGCLSLVSSKPGVGKTTVLMALCAAAGQGWEFLEKKVTPHRILLVTEEGARSILKKRDIFGPLPHVTLHSVDFGDFETEDWAERVRQMADVAARVKADAIIVDTMFSFALTDDEDKSAKTRPLFKRLRSLSRMGYAIVVTVHSRKVGGTGTDQIAGSVAIPGEVDIAFALGPSPDGDPAHREMTWIKNRLNHVVVGSGTTVITTDGPHLIVVDSPKAKEKDILDVLADNEWYSRAEIATALSTDEGKLRYALDRLCTRNAVQKKQVPKPRKHDEFRLVRPLVFDLGGATKGNA